MTDRLTGLTQLAACAELQRAILGDRSRSIWPVPALTAIGQSGGLVLGSWDGTAPVPRLLGALVDLVGDIDGYPARHTVFHGVHPSHRNRGVGGDLRLVERAVCQRAGVDLVFWALDPLRSVDAHLAFNKLGAIATEYQRNLYGELSDNANRGLATDRLRVEWWLDAPRVRALLDRGNPAAHLRLGIHQMHVVTETRLGRNGVRALTGYDDAPHAEHVLAEIPADLDRLRALDPAVARDWRVQSRSVFELLFDRGYVAVGFIHEGGRSFHLFREANRRIALRDT